MVWQRHRDTKVSETLKFKPMRLLDLPEVLYIEKQSFRNPWSEEDFKREITLNQKAMYLVALEDETIVGYVGTWLLGDEGHITNIAVEPIKRGKGYGKRLAEEAVKYLWEKGASYIILEVRISNLVAITLYQSLGFRIASRRFSYYVDNNEDAYVMIKKLKKEDDSTRN